MQRFTADPTITEAISKPESKGGIVGAARFVFDRLKSAGLISEMALPPMSLGIHPTNRGKYGVNEETVHLLGGDILSIGWDRERVRGAIAVEEDPVDRYIERFNQEIAAKTDRLAPVESMSIRAGTLTNGHTTLMLRALMCGVPSTAPRISVGGHMSLAHVAEQSRAMAEAAQTGWSWSVLHHSTRALYGDALFILLSDAANVSVNRQDSEAQAMLKLHSMALDIKAKGGNIDWQELQAVVLRNKPVFAETVPLLARFVRDFGGTKEVNFVKEFAEFHRRFVPNERFVGSTFYEVLGGLVVKRQKGAAPEALPLLRWSLLKAQFSCQDGKVVNRECKLISKSDVDSIAKKRLDQAIQCEAVLSSCRDIAHSVKARIDETSLVKLFGRLDCCVARFFRKQCCFRSFVICLCCYFVFTDSLFFHPSCMFTILDILSIGNEMTNQGIFEIHEHTKHKKIQYCDCHCLCVLRFPKVLGAAAGRLPHRGQERRGGGVCLRRRARAHRRSGHRKSVGHAQAVVGVKSHLAVVVIECHFRR